MSKLLHQSFFRTLLSPTFMDQTLDNPQTFLLSCYRKYDALFYIHKIEIFFFFTYFWDTIYNTFVEKIKRIQIHV